MFAATLVAAPVSVTRRSTARRAAGSVEDFRYSKALEEAAEGGLVWTEETLGEFLANPRKYLKGTKMAFAGLRKDEDQAAIAAYLSTFE
mgnify:CR=1 FL=1